MLFYFYFYFYYYYYLISLHLLIPGAADRTVIQCNIEDQHLVAKVNGKHGQQETLTFDKFRFEELLWSHVVMSVEHKSKTTQTLTLYVDGRLIQTHRLACSPIPHNVQSATGCIGTHPKRASPATRTLRW